MTEWNQWTRAQKNNKFEFNHLKENENMRREIKDLKRETLEMKSKTSAMKISLDEISRKKFRKTRELKIQ